MYTRCPHCQTVFHLRAEQLKAAHGQVRCGDCSETFQSLDHLYDEPEHALRDVPSVVPGLGVGSATATESAKVSTGAVSVPPSEPESPSVPVPEESEPQAALTETHDTAAEVTEERVDLEAVEPEPVTTAILEETEETETTPEPDEPTQAVAEEQTEADNTALADAMREIDAADEGATLSESPPEWLTESPQQEPETDEIEQLTADPRAREFDNVGQSKLAGGPEAPDKDTPQEPDLLPKFEVPPELLLATPRPERVSKHRLAGWTAVAALCVLLAGQGVYAWRAKLADDPALLPWVARFCAVVNCELPFQRDVARIQLLERALRNHPKQSDGLQAQATFVNKAPFIQPYPTLELRLTDLSGELSVGRRFTPEEYLPSDTNVKAGMAPDKPVNAELELLQPATEMVSYQFDFH